MPKISEEAREARREQILAAARRCFLRKGFHETSMLDLFAEVGLSSGSVYLYFKSKDDVIMAIAEENLHDVVAVIHTLASSDSASGSLGIALAHVLRLVEKKHEETELGPLSVLVWSEAMRNPSLRHRFETAVARMREDLTDVVRGYQQQGKLPTEASAEALATLFISIVPGVLLQLALFGQDQVNGIPEAAEALWPV
jgi:AcrR family transcriptional regulator